MRKTGAPPGTQSVLRAIALLKTLARCDKDRDLAALTTEVGLSRTTTHRLLRALESEGLVSQDPTFGTYRLGPTAVTLGTCALRSNDLRAVVHPYLVELASACKETATLELLADGGMLILDEVLGRHLLATTPSLGTSWPLHATATGKVILATLPPAEAGQLISGRLKRFTTQTVTRKSDLLAQLEPIRECGHAVAREELEQGFIAVAAPILDAAGRPAGALSVNATTSRLHGRKLERTARQVRDSAARASAVLGHLG